MMSMLAVKWSDSPLHLLSTQNSYSPHKMKIKRNLIWRSPEDNIDYSSCNNIDLSGVLIPALKSSPLIASSSDNDNNNDNIEINQDHLPTHLTDMQYMPGCYGQKPAYSANKRFGLKTLPIVDNDWTSFINQRKEGEFMYSVYPTIYSVTAATVVTCFLTVIVFTNTQKPSYLLILGCLLSSINLIYLLTSTMRFLSGTISLGMASGENLLDNIQSNLSFNIIDLFSVFILQLCQVQIIMRLFSRQKEKRFTFVMGVSLSIISQVIWAVSTFHTMKHTDLTAEYDPDEDTLSILPAFIYLLRIAMSVMYSVLICIYCFIKIEFIMKRSLILISFVSILSTNLQFAFFIADVANVWVAELSEVFNAAGYVVSTVIVWEWINRVHASERAKQSKGILGRPFYEEELQGANKVDRISLFVPEEEKNLFGYTDTQDDNHDNDSFNGRPTEEITGSGDLEHPAGNGANITNKKPPLQAHNLNAKLHDFVSNQQLKTREFVSSTIPEMIMKTTNTFLYLTDQIIAYGLAVPRSVSVNSRERREKRRIEKKLKRNRRQQRFARRDNDYDDYGSNLDDSSDSGLFRRLNHFSNSYTATTTNNTGTTTLSESNNNRQDEGSNSSNSSDNTHNENPIFIYTTAEVNVNQTESDSESDENRDEEDDQIYRYMDDVFEGANTRDDTINDIEEHSVAGGGLYEQRHR